MLTLSGINRFYFIPKVTDMRYGYKKLIEIVRNSYHMDSKNGDVFIFMSKDRRTVKMVNFENHAYYLHQKTFIKGYHFLKLEWRDERPVYKMEWKDLITVLETPVVTKLELGYHDVSKSVVNNCLND